MINRVSHFVFLLGSIKKKEQKIGQYLVDDDTPLSRQTGEDKDPKEQCTYRNKHENFPQSPSPDMVLIDNIIYHPSIPL